MQENNNIPDHTVLLARDISIGYQRGKKVIKEVHRGLSFNLRAGELTCLLGPNGAGKSTLIRSLGASQKLICGEILLNGKPLSNYKEREISRHIGLVLTEKTAVGALRVSELVALGRHPHTGFFGRLTTTDLQVIDKSMEATGIIHKKEQYVAELSDGERQKAMIAKALAQESPIIILDEPTSFLDIISRIEIMNLLRKLARSHQKAILLSTHDLEQALASADRLWLLSKENGLTCGVPEDMIFNNAMDNLFQHKEISFDKLSGSFRLPAESEIPVHVEATQELLFWTKNLLNRYGFRPAKYTEISTFKIKVQSAQAISVQITGEKEIHLSSFASVIPLLLMHYDS